MCILLMLLLLLLCCCWCWSHCRASSLFATGFAINNYRQLQGQLRFFRMSCQSQCWSCWCCSSPSPTLPLCLPLSRSFSLTGFCILKAISSAFFAFVVFALLRFFPFLCIFCSFNNKRKQKLLLSIFGLFAAVAVVSVVVVVCSGKKMCCQS